MQKRIFHTFKRVISNKYFPIIVLIIVNLFVGSLIVTDYGESWDEAPRYKYAEISLNAYLDGKSVVTDEKGPFFVMASTLVSDKIYSLRQNWFIEDARHYVHFFSFIAGLFFLYKLIYRLTDKWAAFAAVILFNIQPLLWGHAFINPKDTPFMVFFIASIDLGIAMVEAYQRTNGEEKPRGLQNPSPQSLKSQLKNEWKGIPSKMKIVVIICLAGILLAAGLCFSQGYFQERIENLVFDIYSDNSYQVLENIFSSIAPNKDLVPVESYIQKALELYTRSMYFLIPAILIICTFIILKLLPRTSSALWHNGIKDGCKGPKAKLVAAGLFWGLTCSIRTLGLAAGGLIGLYFLLKEKGRSFRVLIPYFLIAAVTTYITWPSLWDAPVRSYIESLFLASDFPWTGKVLFNGTRYSVGTFPISYFPVLISIQFTLTALLTSAAGFVLGIYRTFKGSLDWRVFTIIVLWLIAPFILVIILKPTIYDNFRHMLFAIPPMFIFGSFGIQAVFNRIKKPFQRILIILILILPNIFSLIRLHPYQYVYYNAFTNGVDGAFRNYEMDYWGTSYREAANYLNDNAPLNSRVLVLGASHIVNNYARKDLVIDKLNYDLEIGDFDCASPQFLVVSSRNDADIKVFPDADNLYTIGKGDAVFAVVKNLNTSHLCDP